jgi:lipopolysaccharide transport system ATP-binding protein
MTNGTVIKVGNVSKKYCRELKHTMLYGIQDISKNAVGLSSRSERLRDGEFWALNDVSFEVKKGESIGIIGANGSGKSTLLKLLSGIFMPDRGRIEIKGKIGALIEVGAGFHPMLTGRENIYVNGSILGMTKKGIDKKFDEIVDFAGIGDFIDSPVKHYSSGMYVRLGFAVAVHCEPDILLVDEALAVGDAFFQAKCIAKMNKMINAGTTLLFVSHDVGTVKSVCQKTLLLNTGEIIDFNKSDKVVEKFFSMRIANEQAVVENIDSGKGIVQTVNRDKYGAFENIAEFQKRASYQRIQNGRAVFINVQLLDESENEIHLVEYEQNVILRMAVEIRDDIDLLAFGYHIRDRNGVDAVYSGSNIENNNLNIVKKGERYIIDWKFKVSLMHGYYNVACILAIPLYIEIGKVDICDFASLAVQFEMQPRTGAKLHGLVHWNNSVEIKRVDYA